MSVLLSGVADQLVAGEVNVLRLSLHPEGLATRIINFHEWRAHILSRFAHEIDVSSSQRLVALLDELKSYPASPHAMSRRVVRAVLPIGIRSLQPIMRIFERRAKKP